MGIFTSNSLSYEIRYAMEKNLNVKSNFAYTEWKYDDIEISLKSREKFHLRFHEYQDQLDQLKSLSFQPDIESELIVILAKEVYFGYLKSQFRNFSVERFLESLLLLIFYNDLEYEQKFFIAGDKNAYQIMEHFLYQDSHFTIKYNKKKNEIEVYEADLGERTVKKAGVPTIKKITELNGIKELKKKHKDSGSNIKIDKGRDGLFKTFFAEKMTHKNLAYEPTMAFIEDLSDFMLENIRRNTMQFDIDFNITSTEEYCKTLLFFCDQIEEKRKNAAINMIEKLIPNFEIEYLPGKFRHHKQVAEISSDIFQNLIRIMQINTDFIINSNNEIIFRRKKSQFNLNIPDYKLFVLEIISSLKIGNTSIPPHILSQIFYIKPFDRLYENIKDIFTHIDKYKDLIDYSKNELELNKPDNISIELFIENISEVIKNSSVNIDDVIIDEYKKNVVKIWLNKFALYFRDYNYFIDYLDKDIINIRFESEIKGVPIDISNRIISIATHDFNIKIKDDHFLVLNLRNLEEDELIEKVYYELEMSGIYRTDSNQTINLKKCFRTESDGNNLILIPSPFKNCFDILYNSRSENTFRDYMKSGNIDEYYEPLKSFLEQLIEGERILDPFVIQKSMFTAGYEETKHGQNRSAKAYSISNNLIKLFSISTINIGGAELYFESKYIRPYFTIDQIEDKLLIKNISSIDYLHQLLVSVVNVYNKKLNLFAKTRPKKIIEDFQGGRFAVSESIKNSIKKAKKTPKQIYKKPLLEESAYIFIAFDRSASMNDGSKLNYQYLLALLGYGFHHRFKSLVYGLICEVGEGIGEIDLTELKKTNNNYMRINDSTNYDIAYNNLALSVKYDDIIKNIKEIQNDLTNPAIPNKNQLKIKLRLLTEELYRTKYNKPSTQSLIYGISNEDRIYTSSKSIRIRYGNLTDKELEDKGINPTFEISKKKIRRFWEFNNIKEYLKVVARENKINSGSSNFSGAYDLIEHPLLMKGKGLKYFFILTDAGANEGSGERAMRPMSGRYSNAGGLVGVTYNLERVASRSDTRFAYFYYSDVSFPSVVDGTRFANMKDDSRKTVIKREALVYKTKSESHILNWTKETANALFYIQTDDSEIKSYLWDLKIIEEMIQAGLMKPYESKYFEEKCLEYPLNVLIDTENPKLPIHDDWKKYCEKRIMEGNIRNTSSRGKKEIATYLHLDFIRRYWQNVFMVNFTNTFSNSIVYLIFKRLSKLKFFVTDPI